MTRAPQSLFKAVCRSKREDRLTVLVALVLGPHLGLDGQQPREAPRAHRRKPALGRSDAYPSQPICVADFTGSGEDGVLLSVDAAGESSYPLVLDAETIHERARARVPHHLPFAIQGEF